MIEILRTEEAWNLALQETKNFDCYHTPEYHKVRLKENEVPFVVYYKQGEHKILIPFIKRPVFNSEYYDLSSVHGYLGPASTIDQNTFDVNAFSESFEQLMKDENIICAFSKLNPYLLHQELILGRLGELEHVGELVYLDLETDPIIQRQNYRKSVKNDVNKLRRNFNVRTATSAEDIDTFIDIYSETMQRVSADSRFKLGQDYFYTLSNSKNFHSRLLLVESKETGEVVAGSVSLITNGIIQGEHMGTKTAFLPMSPAKLLYDEIRLIGNELNQKYLNYGGGPGGKEGPLFIMKFGFSKDLMPVKVWKHIVNQELYEHFSSQVENTNEVINYFPKYRTAVLKKEVKD
ncbi:GNAT family N-acetyltransferase [Robiginitalea sp.]|nr:GNAT family N-acetyltransferase [Robiginitalea sp.]